MHEIHRTADGDELLVSQMRSPHLKNTIALLCKRIKQSIQIIEADGESQNKVLAVLQPRYSMPNVKEAAKRQLRNLDRELQPYIVEAALRRIEVWHYLQDAYGRSEAIERPFTALKQPATIEVESEVGYNGEDDDDDYDLDYEDYEF